MTGLSGIFGRLHPLVLHLPIGLLAALVLLELASISGRLEVSRRTMALLVTFTALSAVLAASTGWFLGEQGDHHPLVLDRHRVLGLSVAAGSVIFALLHAASRQGSRPGLLRAYRAILFATALVLAPTGHFGATMTHGAGYLLDRRQVSVSAPAEAIGTDDGEPAQRSTFELEIAPVFAANCTACHGDTKRKSKLSLAHVATIQAGGEGGPILVPGRPEESEILRRLRLPLDDEDHMPPEGKPQPGPDEISRIESWIRAGAPFEGRIDLGVLPGPADSETGKSDTAEQPEARPSRPDPAALAALALELVHVEELDAATSELWVDFAAIAPKTDDPLAARLLEPLREHVAHLSLARTRIGPATLALCARMPRLRRLDLRETPIGDAELASLGPHPALAELVLSQTAVTDATVDALLTLPALERVYLWKTSITPEGLARLSRERPGLGVDSAGTPDAAVLEVEPEIRLTSDRALPGSESGVGDPLAPINTKCPISGSPVNARYGVVYGGKVIGFCCPECPKQFWADPEAALAKIQ